MAIISITQANFKKEVEESTLPVVIDVHAVWCGPCQQMAPIFDELEKELGRCYKFVKLNVDEARELSIKFGVTSVPTFLFIKNNALKGKEIGYMSKDQLQKKIVALLGEEKKSHNCGCC
jgi:thioredoxin 1